VPYSQPLFAGGTVGAVTWTLNKNNSPLLNWLSLSPSGVLTGTPTSYGTTPSFTVTVTDSLNQTASTPASIFVTGPLDIVTTTLREGVVLENPPALPVVGGNGNKAVTLTGGSLPPGITLNSSGSFSGTPTHHGSFAFSVHVTDCTPSTSCTAATGPQTIDRNLTWRVSARDQQAGSSDSSTITFGGTGGVKLAQTITAGAAGQLTAFGFNSTTTCPSFGPVTVEIQRLTLAGLPDGITIASGTTSGSLAAIAIAPAVDLAIDSRFAAVISSPTACTMARMPASLDSYQAGDAFVDSGSGWAPMFGVDGRYDIPFRTLVQPAIDVAYLNRSRGQFTATVLNTGKVLLTGNDNTAELYDPATNTSTPTGTMTLARQNHAAALLADGSVLLVGGRDSTGNRVASAEIYNPATGTFAATAGPLAAARDNFTATRLSDGRVLVLGGNGISSILQSAEVYDPITRVFSAAGNMTTPRANLTAVLLQNNKVLIAGGFGNGSTCRPNSTTRPLAHSRRPRDRWSCRSSVRRRRHACSMDAC